MLCVSINALETGSFDRSNQYIYLDTLIIRICKEPVRLG